LLAARSAAVRIDTLGRAQPLLLIEPLNARSFDIAVFGAGHVGSAVVNLLSTLECDLRWIDSRRHIFPERVPRNVQCIETDSPPQEVAALPGRAFYLVMTHSHAIDYDICASILARREFAYCGLIGSVSKRRRFVKRFAQQGIGDAQVKRLVCPIGVSGITGKQPVEIAIAVCAEILRRRDRLAANTGASSANVHTLKQ
jgi:xanthine dehydrogenase accessory factor